MGYKCTPQIIGLVRGEPKAGAKHRANGKAILQELGNERYSKSVTLDRTRSIENEYKGFQSGGKCWDAMCRKAGAYKQKIKTKDGRAGERGLRSDAVIGWSVIFNPPAEMAESWTKQDYQRFYKDSLAALAEIRPELFRQSNARMTAKHRDEGVIGPNGEYGEHMHVVGDAIAADGRYCGNLIDAKLMVDVNKKYPALMRAKGWDLDDLDLTDFSRMGTDPEYKASRRSRKAGRSVNKYVAEKTQETVDQAVAMYDEADRALQSAIAIQQEITTYSERPFGTKKKTTLADLATAKQIVQEQQAEIDSLKTLCEAQEDQLKQSDVKLHSEVDKALREQERRHKQEVADLQADNATVTKRYERVQRFMRRIPCVGAKSWWEMYLQSKGNPEKAIESQKSERAELRRGMETQRNYTTEQQDGYNYSL